MQEKTLKNNIKLFEEQIDKAEKITIIPHVNPDGDAIGSALALYQILKKLNKQVQVLSPNDFADFLKWLPYSDEIQIFDKEKNEFLSKSDLIIAVDFNETNRTGQLKEEFNAQKSVKILIDHHPNPDNFAEILFSNITYSSTAEYIFDIISQSKYSDTIDKDIATCLLTGIMTDTGGFSYGSSNPGTFLVTAELLKKGADKEKIYINIYNSFSENRIRFLGNALLNGMKYMPEYKTAYIKISKTDRKTFKEQIGDTENFVNYPLSIKDCIFSAIFIERNKFIKISFRSKGDFSAADFAKKYFNGGGHKNAAGGESNLSLDKAIEKFEKALSEYKTELNTI